MYQGTSIVVGPDTSFVFVINNVEENSVDKNCFVGTAVVGFDVVY